MAQLVNTWHISIKSMVWIPSTHIKKPRVAPCAYYPSAKEVETGAALVVAGQID